MNGQTISSWWPERVTPCEPGKAGRTLAGDQRTAHGNGQTQDVVITKTLQPHNPEVTTGAQKQKYKRLYRDK